MTLAAMLAVDREALICDFAETYRIYDIGSLPVKLAATLACGLRDDSRIKMKMAGQKIDTQTALLALIFDSISILLWSRQKRATGANKPKSMYKALTDTPEKHKEVTTYKGHGFSSIEELDAALKRIDEGAQ